VAGADMGMAEVVEVTLEAALAGEAVILEAALAEEVVILETALVEEAVILETALVVVIFMGMDVEIFGAEAMAAMEEVEIFGEDLV
jgi:hypothetical protein